MATVLTIFCMTTLAIVSGILCNKCEKQFIGSNKTVSEKVNIYDVVDTDEEMIVIAYSVVREEPSDDSTKIDTYNKGDKVRVIGKLSNNWYKVKTNKNIGYVKSENIKSTKEVFIDNGGVVISSVVADGTIEVDGDITSSMLNYAYNYWYLIPENIRNDFREQGWKIVITDKSLSQELELTYEISGATIPNEKIIKIYNSQSCIRYALIHEIGHYIDCRNNFISRSDDFKKMYKENGSKMLEYNSNYIQASYSEEEYFAELYRAYLIGDYKIKFIFSDDIKFVSDISKVIGTVCKDNAA